MGKNPAQQRFFTQNRSRFEWDIASRTEAQLLDIAVPLAWDLDMLRENWRQAAADYHEAHYRWAAVQSRMRSLGLVGRRRRPSSVFLDSIERPAANSA